MDSQFAPAFLQVFLCAAVIAIGTWMLGSPRWWARLTTRVNHGDDTQVRKIDGVSKMVRIAGVWLLVIGVLGIAQLLFVVLRR